MCCLMNNYVVSLSYRHNVPDGPGPQENLQNDRMLLAIIQVREAACKVLHECSLQLLASGGWGCQGAGLQ